MVPVNRLPDLALLVVFKQLPLKDQISACKVCTKWCSLVLEANRHVHFLTLLVGAASENQFNDILYRNLVGTSKAMRLLLNDDGTAMFPDTRLTEWNSLQFDSLDENIMAQISSTFLNINKLELAIIHREASQFNYLVCLLNKWRYKLVTFRFIEDCADVVWTKAQIDRLYEAINSLSTLKSLHLFLWHLDHRDLPILSQLEEFKFNSNKATPDQFLELLQKHGQGNASLARVVYESGGDEYRDHYLEQFNSLSEHLRGCFTQLFFPFGCSDPAPICANFGSLTRLFLAPFDMTFRYLFYHLAKLNQLIYLNLFIFLDTLEVDAMKDIPLPQVKSLKALRMSLRMKSHLELARLNIQWTMPNVQIIEFYIDDKCKCIDCSVMVFGLSIHPAIQNTAKDCLRQLFRPLKANCGQLRLIMHNHEDTLGLAEELLAE